jgi:Holliday junction resolvasome RuvABC endonuclease subunit
MDRIVGVDTSLTSTGLAVITSRTDGTTLATTTTITSRGRRDDGLPERNTRIHELAGAIDHAAGPCVLAVVEGPAHGSKGGSPLDRHHLWWLVVSGLLARGAPVAVCAPATRARFATGNGRADKAAVSAAISRCWPDLPIENADEADALVLAQAGAVAMGWAVVTLQRHHDALEAIRWPAGWDRTVLAPSGAPNPALPPHGVLR